MINLLPPEEKRILKEEKQFRTTVFLLSVVLFFIIFGSLILFLISFHLESQILAKEALLAQKKREVRATEIEILEQKMADSNQIFKKVNSFYKNQFFPTKILEALTNNLPEDSYLLSLEFQLEDDSLRISGFVPSREDLIVFRENLKEDPFFEKVDFPASNWIKAVEVEFFANLKVQKNELKN